MRRTRHRAVSAQQPHQAGRRQLAPAFGSWKMAQQVPEQHQRSSEAGETHNVFWPGGYGTRASEHPSSPKFTLSPFHTELEGGEWKESIQYG